jgi:hypothetical protein
MKPDLHNVDPKFVRMVLADKEVELVHSARDNGVEMPNESDYMERPQEESRYSDMPNEQTVYPDMPDEHNGFLEMPNEPKEYLEMPNEENGYLW